MHRGLIAAVALATLTLAGCGGPDDADVTACETFGDAHNALVRSLTADPDRETVRALSAAIPDKAQDAADVAADPGLVIQLGDAADYATAGVGPGTTDDDAGTAYWLTAPDIFTTCQDLGVDVEEADLPPE